MATAERAGGVSEQAQEGDGCGFSLETSCCLPHRPHKFYQPPAWSLSPISSQAFSSTLPQQQVWINSAGKRSPTETFLEPKGGMRWKFSFLNREKKKNLSWLTERPPWVSTWELQPQHLLSRVTWASHCFSLSCCPPPRVVMRGKRCLAGWLSFQPSDSELKAIISLTSAWGTILQLE